MNAGNSILLLLTLISLGLPSAAATTYVGPNPNADCIGGSEASSYESNSYSATSHYSQTCILRISGTNVCYGYAYEHTYYSHRDAEGNWTTDESEKENQGTCV